MGSLNFTLEIARGTLLNTQVSIQTATHNIDNADNKAYARQSVSMVTNQPYELREGWLGMGARVDRITQQRDQYIEKSLMTSISKAADYETRSTQLARVTSFLSDDGSQGISQTLGAFWDAWDALNQNPSGTTEQTLVKQAAQNLATAVQEAYSNVTDLAADVETQAGSEVTKVSGLLSAIADYNSEITKMEVGGDSSANDMRDLRYQALTELSQYIPITYEEQSDGSVTVSLKDYSSDITLVSANMAGSLAFDATNHRITYSDYQGSAYPPAPEPTPPDQNSLSAGSLNGLMTVYNSIGTSHDPTYAVDHPDDPSLTYLDRLNVFAYTLITEVNNVHSQGGGSNVYDASVLGSSFKASDLKVDPNFQIDSGQALNMAELQDTRFGALGDTQFSGYLSNIQQRLGSDQQNAQSLGSFQEALRDQLQSQQQSVSGVSIDEEMVDMIKLQQIYQAAAKIIQQTSEMLNSIIQMV